MAKKKSHFEEDMKVLEDIVQKMNAGSLSLEESIQLFEQGLKLSKKCTEQLNQAQQKIQKIISSNSDEDLKIEDFTDSEKSS